jgi:UDP-hydrolysing UDP-N-acetyl-D-glucosamine 2-epimerase
MVRIAVVVTARPSWAKLFTICEALQAMPDVDLQIIACASALLERYGNVSKVIQAQGFTLAAECWSTYEGANLVTSVKETGALVSELGTAVIRLGPACVVVCADRHEVLAAAIAGSYQHIRVAHLQGGERTGSIDDRVRDSITSLADLHFPCTEQAAFRVYGLTGSQHIYRFGCSAVDMAKRAISEPPVTSEELGGAGAPIDLERPYSVILQHPVTNEAEQAYAQMWSTLMGSEMCGQRVVLWPGQDAGADGISKAIREYQAEHGALHTVRNLPPSRFLKLLSQCEVLIGNSSAGIRESAYLGVPVVDIGTRQWGRERAKNVQWVPHDVTRIQQAIQQQSTAGFYPRSTLYGDGTSGQQIARVLRDVAHGSTRPGEVEIHGHPV